MWYNSIHTRAICVRIFAPVIYTDLKTIVTTSYIVMIVATFVIIMREKIVFTMAAKRSYRRSGNFAELYFRVINLAHLNFRHPSDRRKFFNSENFPIYGT